MVGDIAVLVLCSHMNTAVEQSQKSRKLYEEQIAIQTRARQQKDKRGWLACSIYSSKGVSSKRHHRMMTAKNRGCGCSIYVCSNRPRPQWKHNIKGMLHCCYRVCVCVCARTKDATAYNCHASKRQAQRVQGPGTERDVDNRLSKRLKSHDGMS